MQKRKTILLLLPLLLLTSCGANKAAILRVNDFDYIANEKKLSETVDISTAQLINMMESGMSFPLLFHSNNCSSCHVVSDFTENYISATDSLIYSYEYSTKVNEYTSLNAYNPDLFPLKFSTPRFLIFKNGSLSIEINSSKFGSYKLFSNSLKAFLKQSNLYSLTSFESFEAFKTTYSSYAFFTYNSQNVDSLKVYNNYIYVNANKLKTPILAIDVNKLSQDSIDSFKQYFSIMSIFNVFNIVDNSSLIESVNYSDNLSKFETTVSDYFE